jgi:hypothetical protein
MRRFTVQSVLVTAMTMISIGCGGAASTPRSVAPSLAQVPSLPEWLDENEQQASVATSEEAQFDTSGLPASPWSEAPLASNEAPAAVMSAWEHADNRAACAPIAPRELGDAGRSARARVGDFDGGWSVEFDQRGQPGIARNGEICERCGRGVFGIAATNLSPSDLVAEDSTAEAPQPSFADGSHVTVEQSAENEPVAATIAIGDCVYQVWSFLGEDHVRELVGSLRVVDVSAPETVAAY